MVNARRVVGGLLGTARFLGRAGRQLAGRAARGLAEEAKVTAEETKKFAGKAAKFAKKVAKRGTFAEGPTVGLGVRSRALFGVTTPKALLPKRKRKKRRRARRGKDITIVIRGNRGLAKKIGKVKIKRRKRKRRKS